MNFYSLHMMRSLWESCSCFLAEDPEGRMGSGSWQFSSFIHHCKMHPFHQFPLCVHLSARTEDGNVHTYIVIYLSSLMVSVPNPQASLKLDTKSNLRRLRELQSKKCMEFHVLVTAHIPRRPPSHKHWNSVDML